MRAPRSTPLLIAALTVVALVGCSRSSETGAPGTSTTGNAASTIAPGPTFQTTTSGDPDATPNPIPFDVGELTARAHDWRMGVTKVVRPFVVPGLAAVANGREYVAVDFTLTNDGTTAVHVAARNIFGVADEKGTVHKISSGAQGVTGLDGTYAPGSTHSGRLVFEVPASGDLLLILDGPAIHTQRTIFQVDPPHHPAVD